MVWLHWICRKLYQNAMARKILKLLLIAHGTPFAPMNEWLLTPRAAQKKENPLSIWCPVKIGSTNVPQRTRVMIDVRLCSIFKLLAFDNNLPQYSYSRVWTFPANFFFSHYFSSSSFNCPIYKYCSDLIKNCTANKEYLGMNTLEPKVKAPLFFSARYCCCRLSVWDITKAIMPRLNSFESHQTCLFDDLDLTPGTFFKGCPNIYNSLLCSKAEIMPGKRDLLGFMD